jgi:c-di-GMP-binding flagellar brake protein YcgR
LGNLPSADLSFHDDSGFVGFHTRVTRAPKTNQQSIMLEGTESPEHAKARKHWRVETDLAVSIKGEQEEQYTEATLCDLSIEKALVTIEAAITAGSMLEMLFQLTHQAPHAILLQAVYCAPVNNNLPNRYGLRFVELSEEAHDTLIMYLYKKIQETYPQQLRDLYPRPEIKKR